MTPSVHETAARALDVIPSPRYWTKKQWHGGQAGERHCFAEALHSALKDSKLSYRHVFTVANEIIKAQFPERRGSSVVAFNDHSQTRYADVRLVLEKMAARED